jgi:hypothetical protein
MALRESLVNSPRSYVNANDSCLIKINLPSNQQESALVKQLRYKAVEQRTLSSPLRILAVADGGTAPMFDA